MPVIDAVNRREERRIERIDAKSEYSRVVIKLDDVNMIGTDIELGIYGNYLAKITCDGSAVSFKFRLRQNSKLYVDEFQEAYIDFDKIYLTNVSSQAGKELVILVGNAATIHMDTEKELMISAELSVATDAEEDTIAAPGAGKALEILGYSITEMWDAAILKGTSARMWFGTMGSAGHWIWEGMAYQTGVIGVNQSNQSGIRIRGDENQKLTLRNMDVTAGESRINAVVYYKVVGI